ncbi:MAG: hypothetical protein H6Q69_520 [Firmicutes bacterium]|nr:hypothetical protein [Bacillota bacterium]
MRRLTAIILSLSLLVSASVFTSQAMAAEVNEIHKQSLAAVRSLQSRDQRNILPALHVSTRYSWQMLRRELLVLMSRLSLEHGPPGTFIH